MHEQGLSFNAVLEQLHTLQKQTGATPELKRFETRVISLLENNTGRHLRSNGRIALNLSKEISAYSEQTKPNRHST